ncbi:UNVERIFIED_CONTAM: hypothetical protein GTU68_000664 [Idotea baltica]|nr:hypothetical protein [Idotea baltica]
MKSLSRLFILTCIVFQTACIKNEVVRDPAYAIVRPVATPAPEQHNGGIFNVSNNISLFEDYRPSRPGDILTVRLDERTDAEKATQTIVLKNNSNTMDNPTVFGSTPHTNDNSLAFDLNTQTNFLGQGDSDQSNRLVGDVTVSVVEVLANGNLLIRGEKVITVNNGNEYIRISGMINPRDIDGNRTISSKRVADAQISYVGDGQTADANVMGWLSRFFVSTLMPF